MHSTSKVDYYSNRIQLHQNDLKKIKGKLVNIVLARLITFLLIPGIYFIIPSQIPIAVSISIILLVLFMFLLKINGKLQFRKNYLEGLIKINQNEISALNGDFSFSNNGSQFANSMHSFSHDIDLYGEGGFYQKINRTYTEGGNSKLNQLLSGNDTSNIEQKQLAFKELAQLDEFREHFKGMSISRTKTVGEQTMKNWFVNFKNIIREPLKFFAIGFSIVSIVMVVLLSLDLITPTHFVIWFVGGMLIAGSQLKKVLTFSSEINQIAESIAINEQLLYLIENQNFTSDLLIEIQNKIKVEGYKASTSLKSFKSAIDLFNNRNNLLVAIAGNALFLWDIHTVSRIQKWIKTNQQSISNWVDVIYEMDAQISLATFVFNHPEYVFATLDKTENTFIDAHDLGHPLIAIGKCVTNSVQIDKKQFFIITGANMAGKSTFLRTIALSIVMSNCGLPVFASRFRYSPMKLITSMRSTDSLKDDESYFFSELKRLKYIVDIVQNEPYFIILDEILKGTNSKDKEEGSKKFVERLVNMSATGLIATHDLGLCTIESYLPQIKNYYFDAEIINDELHFDYTMKNGVCKNMNASFLLRKMNIVTS